MAVLACVSLAAPGLATQGTEPTPAQPAPGPQATPAQQKMAWAEKTIQASPGKFQAYNQLALALVRRVRETSDPAYYSQAEEAVSQSLRLRPDNFEALKIEVSIMLGRQEFSQALERARALNRRAPDDVPVYGYTAEAEIALGDYDDAENAAQWMLDLRPGNVAGLVEGAWLRRLYGDIEGAVDFLNQAYQQTPPSEVEETAWLLTQMADVQLKAGKVDVAASLLDRALGVFPGYYAALEGLAQVRTARGQYAEALDALRERNRNLPTLASLYQLAQALERSGRADEAGAAYADFEDRARRELERGGHASRELIFYYAGHACKPAEALRIARREVLWRHDVFTLDADAWALYVNAQYTEAETQMNKALSVGIRDGEFFYHAGQIASKLGNQAQAASYLKESLDLGYLPELRKAAREALESLGPASAVASSAKRKAGDNREWSPHPRPLSRKGRGGEREAVGEGGRG